MNPTSSSIPKDRVIVIGCSLTGYAVIRALADKNLDLIALTYTKRDVAHLSRYVSEVARCPAPEDEKDFVACLMENARRWEGALILETADDAAVALSKNKQKLSRFYRIATPEWQVLSLFVEKQKTYALAREYGIPHPRSIPFSRWEDLEISSEILFPCILKPVRSSEFSSRFHAKNFEVHDPDELREKFRLCLEADQSMILQEIIPGPDDRLYKMQGYVNSRGTLVGKFFYRKLRQSPPRFGIARVGISTARDPEVERLTEELLRRANYRGYFSNEFKLDPRDGQLKLIENNCRMPRSGMLAIAAGVNFPWLMYQDLVLDRQSDVADYRVGTYWIELWSDLFNSLFRHRDEDLRLRDYAAPYLSRNKVFADLTFRDPKPFRALVFQNVRHYGRKAYRKANRFLSGRVKDVHIRQLKRAGVDHDLD